MRVSRVEIENFRSIKNLVCSFEEVTSLIGPNGAGKSNILRALDWFFNADKSALSEEDVHKGAIASAESCPRIRVRVDFDDLTDRDRAALGPRYCPDPTTEQFSAWRTWQDGADKITGRAMAYLPFEEIRSLASATAKKEAYNKLRAAKADLALPAWSSAAAIGDFMDGWEREHPERLSDAEVSDTHFFGVAGQGKLSDLFNFVFVSADLRAAEETSAAKDSLLSRILQRAVDKTDFDSAAASLVEDFAAKYASLGEEHLTSQLDDLATDLTTQVAAYSPGRSIRLRNAETTVRPVAAVVEVIVAELATETPVRLQGHGFQRTLLLAALSVLSQRRHTEVGAGQMFLAIEEPELFQHPTQAKAFASVLRDLATQAGQQTQVAYATHSPFFIDPAYFDQVRRVSTARDVSSDCSFTTISSAAIDDVAADLHDFATAATLTRRFDQVCLKYLPNALFAESVILVEGDDDAAILEGLGTGPNALAVGGTCVAPVEGKSNMLIPYAVLKRLDVPVLIVVDNDSGCAARMRQKGRTEEQIEKAVTKHVADNRKLCRLAGVEEEDYPVGAVSEDLAFVPDTLETLLASDLPGWDLARQQIVDDGRGVEGKNAATYALASRECEQAPTGDLHEILSLCVRRAA